MTGVALKAGTAVNHLGNRCKGREGCDGDDDDPWRKFPAEQSDESSDGNNGIEERMKGAGANRTEEGGDENSDDGGIDSAQSGLDERALAQLTPERKNGDDGEQAGKKDGDEGESREQERVDAGPDGRAKVGGEGEERTGKRLGRAVSGEKGLLIDPAGGDDGGFQERENDVASAEDEGSGAVEGIENGDGLGV